MSKTKRLLSPLECIQIAWATKLRDFRQWCMPTTQGVYDWKSRRLEMAIKVARGSMVDDVEAMLRAIHENDSANEVGIKDESGSSVYLPVMITAISAIETPPDYDQVVGLPYWVNVVLPQDPEQRAVQMRSMPVAYRCQIAFFSPDPHSASDISRQFTSFWRHEEKRTFPVTFYAGVSEGKPITVDWDFRVLDNSLYPDDAGSDLKNIHIITVDCTIVGAIPEYVGLDGQWDPVTDKGEPVESLPTRPNPNYDSGRETLPNPDYNPSLPTIPNPNYDPDLPTIPGDPVNPNLPEINGPKINMPRLPIGKPLEGNRASQAELNSMVTEFDAKTNDSGKKRRVTIDPETGLISEVNIDDE